MLKINIAAIIINICGLAMILSVFYFVFGSWFVDSDSIIVVSCSSVVKSTTIDNYSEAILKLPGKSRNIIETMTNRKKVVLCFFVPHQDIRVSMNGVELFRYNAIENSNPYVYYTVNQNQYGKEIKVEFVSLVRRYSQTLYPVYISELGTILSYQNFISAFKYIVSAIFIICSTVLMLYAVIYLRKYTNIAYFLLSSIFIISVGILLAVDTPAFTKFIPYRYLYCVLQFLLYSISVVYFLLIAIQAKKIIKYILYSFSCLMMLMAVTTVVLDSLGMAYAPDTSVLFAVTLILGLLAAFTWAVKFSKEKRYHCYFLLTSILATAFDTAEFIKLSPVEDFRWLKCILLVSAVFLFLEAFENIHIIIKNKATKNEVENFVAGFITENYRILSESIKNMETLRHDVANHYQAISLLYNQNQHSKAIAYLQKLNSEIELALPKVVHNVLLESIVHNKLSAAGNLRVEQTISVPAELPYNDNDICSLIVNILDNAIEAAGKCSDPFINFSAYTKNDMFFVICKNNKSEEIVHTDNVFQSTKEDRHYHGFGLRIINNIVIKYDGTIFIDYDDESFSMNISLPL